MIDNTKPKRVEGGLIHFLSTHGGRAKDAPPDRDLGEFLDKISITGKPARGRWFDGDKWQEYGVEDAQ